MKNTKNLINCLMKTTNPLSILMAMAVSACGQGTLVYDQSSATNPAAGGGAAISQTQPMGQSFTPALSSIGFVQFDFIDAEVGNDNGVGATIYVNLWSGSISNGTLLASTDPVYIQTEAFDLVTNFFFSSAVTLTPGTTYFLQPYLESGDTRMCIVDSPAFNYSGGTLYFNGAPDPNNQDLWFREGVIEVPEPSSLVLILLGSGLFLCVRQKCKKQIYAGNCTASRHCTTSSTFSRW